MNLENCSHRGDSRGCDPVALAAGRPCLRSIFTQNSSRVLISPEHTFCEWCCSMRVFSVLADAGEVMPFTVARLPRTLTPESAVHAALGDTLAHSHHSDPPHPCLARAPHARIHPACLVDPADPAMTTKAASTNPCSTTRRKTSPVLPLPQRVPTDTQTEMSCLPWTTDRTKTKKTNY